ncbi:NfeD family protein [Notoacmeibacter ruber]|uniref:NfeD family protein n=1 Tax=Notoacmeibacter ruber TaxID=2670375 RepID=A0A3L7JCD7_9HYPH|nr:NfeD family protein [Notoacmeibacter ruber]RLQ88458.1 NfeD family protein [Notoacmeibacter ruber]
MTFLIEQLGVWLWIIGGFVLLLLELLIPGVFLLWIGLAALATGAIALVAIGPAADWLVWQTQLAIFLVLSAAFTITGRRYAKGALEDKSAEHLNRRGDALVGRTATLIEPIVNGYGRARIDDSSWRVAGPDLPAGSTVRILDAAEGHLTVEAA